MPDALPLIYRVEDHLALLQLNRPEREHRLSRQLLTALADALRRAEADEAVAVAAITAQGEWFCAGAEMTTATSGVTEALLDFGDAWVRLRDTMADLGKPVIVGVNGRAMAGGLALTALGDLAIAVPHATFGLPELQYGIFPMLVLGAVWEHLPRKIMFDLIYRGRVLGASEAQRLNLINDVVPADDLVSALQRVAEHLAGLNSVAVRLGRRAYHAMEGLDSHRRMDYARNVTANLLRTEAAVELYRRRLGR